MFWLIGLGAKGEVRYGIDAELLLRTLLAWLRGEPRVCSMVPIPSEADEDARRSVRERTELVAERVALSEPHWGRAGDNGLW